METNKLHGITVRKALGLGDLKDLILLGGEKGLDRLILSVNVMEVPDILPWVKEGQLLLTTAYSIKDDPAAQELLIPELAKRGLAGLVIKSKRYLQQIPPVMIQAANDNSFPLIEMPQHLSHPIVLETIYSALVSRHTTILRRSIDAHNKIMKVALESGGIPAISEALYQISENPVFIVGMNAKVLGKAPANVSVDLEEALVSQLGHSQGYYSQYMSTDMIELAERKFKLVKYPIYIAGKWHGTINIIEVNRKLKEVDIIAMEQASTVAALTLINHFALEEIEKKYKNEFLFDWVTGKVGSELELIQRGSVVGFELRYSFVLIILDIDTYDILWQEDAKGKSEITFYKNKLYATISKVSEKYSSYQIVGDRGSRFILLMKADKETPYDKIMANAKTAAKEIAVTFKKDTNQTCSVGIGRYRSLISEISQSYEEATDALDVGKFMAQGDNVYSFEDLGVFRLLCNENLEEVNNIVRELYLPLVEYDKANNSQLVETLRVYLSNTGNVSQVAKQMFVHYNTVIYRLAKLEEVIGLSLNDTEDRFKLQLALKLGDVLGAK